MFFLGPSRLLGHVDLKAHGYFGNGFVNVLCDDGLRLLFRHVDPVQHMG